MCPENNLKKMPLSPEDMLLEAREFVNDIANERVDYLRLIASEGFEKIKDIKFEDIKIEAIDIPQERLPANSQNGEILEAYEEYIKDSNSLLRKALYDFKQEAEANRSKVRNNLLGTLNGRMANLPGSGNTEPVAGATEPAPGPVKLANPSAEAQEPQQTGEANESVTAPQQQEFVGPPVRPAENEMLARIRKYNEAMEAEAEKKDFLKEEPRSENEPDRKKEQLEKSLQASREFYADMRCKKESAYQKVASFFKSKTPLKGFDRKKDADIVTAKQWYDRDLAEYKASLLKEAQEQGNSEEKLKEIVVFFETEAKLNRMEAYDKVRAQAQSGSGKIGQQMVKISEWYRPLPLWKKAGIALGFSGALAGVAFLGGAAVAGATAGTIFAKRVFMASITGTSVMLAKESKDKFNKEVAVERSARIFGEKIAGKSEDQKLALLQGHLDKLTEGYDKEFSDMSRQKTKNLLKGIVAGMVAVGVGELFASQELLAQVKPDWMTFGNETGEGAITPEAKVIPPVGGGLGVENGAKEILSASKTLVIEKGSSFEGTIIKHLSDPNAEIYKHHPELKGVDPGWIASRLALDFAHDHQTGLPSLVHPGDKITINFDSAALQVNGAWEDSVKIDLSDKSGHGILPENPQVISTEKPDISSGPETPATSGAQNPATEAKVGIGQNDSRLESVLQELQSSGEGVKGAENMTDSGSGDPADSSAGEQASPTEKEAAPDGKSMAVTENRLYGHKHGKISFGYDKNGEIVSMQPEPKLSGFKGTENLIANSGDVLRDRSPLGMKSVSVNIATTESKNISGYRSAFDQLMKDGNKKEAKAVLTRIYEIVIGTEKHLGVTVFDRTKLPSM